MTVWRRIHRRASSHTKHHRRFSPNRGESNNHRIHVIAFNVEYLFTEQFCPKSHLLLRPVGPWKSAKSCVQALPRLELFSVRGQPNSTNSTLLPIVDNKQLIHLDLNKPWPQLFVESANPASPLD